MCEKVDDWKINRQKLTGFVHWDCAQSSSRPQMPLCCSLWTQQHNWFSHQHGMHRIRATSKWCGPIYTGTVLNNIHLKGGCCLHEFRRSHPKNIGFQVSPQRKNVCHEQDCVWLGNQTDDELSSICFHTEVFRRQEALRSVGEAKHSEIHDCFACMKQLSSKPGDPRAQTQSSSHSKLKLNSRAKQQSEAKRNQHEASGWSKIPQWLQLHSLTQLAQWKKVGHTLSEETKRRKIPKVESGKFWI